MPKKQVLVHTRSKWHDTSGERPRCTSKRFLWVDNKSIELVWAVFHLFDAVKGDLMRVDGGE